MQLEDEGPRIGKGKMGSPKKVTNKRIAPPMFSNKLEK
jgi:hypothetical protein